MDQGVDLILQIGQFAMVVIAVLVAVMLFFSLIDGHQRDQDSRDERDPRD